MVESGIRVVVMQPISQFPKLRTNEQPQQSRTQDNVSQVLTPIATALSATPLLGAPPPAWVAEDFVGTSWGFYAGVAGSNSASFPHPAHHMDALGYVHIRGAASNASAALAVDLAVVRLPKGLRPNVAVPFPAVGIGATLTAGAFFLVLDTNGFLSTYSVDVPAGEAFSWSFSYLAEQ